MLDLDQLDWNKADGLIPAVVQDARTGQVLMLGYMNRESLERTLQSGLVTFWSRSRQTLWAKGETSGNHLRLRAIHPDCDHDALLVEADPAGPTCHTGDVSCFGRSDPPGIGFLIALERLIESRRRDPPDGSYTAKLFREGLPQICQKLGEESVELIVSVMESRQRGIEEAADVIYHLLIFLASREITLDEVVQELTARHRREAPRPPHPA